MGWTENPCVPSSILGGASSYQRLRIPILVHFPVVAFMIKGFFKYQNLVKGLLLYLFLYQLALYKSE